MEIGIALLGCGTVGGGVLDLLQSHAASLAARSGHAFVVRGVAVRDLKKRRSVGVPAGLLTTDARALVTRADVDIVVEVVGGVDSTRELVLSAIGAGKHVVTANKALLAHCAPEIFRAANEQSVGVAYEAAVAGGIPAIRAIREGLIANNLRGLYGIVNGTSNYILSEMTEFGTPFSEVLAEAQAKGYAEANPALDVDGEDAAHKLSVLTACAYGVHVAPDSVFREGIGHLEPVDIWYARELGFVIKPLAIVTQRAGTVTLRVHPTMVPDDHLLATVNGVFNAIFVQGDPVGDVMFYGRGAGAGPTASAVVSDIVELAQQIGAGTAGLVGPLTLQANTRAGGMDDVETSYYMRITAFDRPGVLAQITQIVGAAGISIAQVLQHERRQGEEVPVVLLTHRTRERAFQHALAQLNALPVVAAPTVAVRVENFEEAL